MLLDLDILELNEPYPEQMMSAADLAVLRLPIVVCEEVLRYFEANANPQDSLSFVTIRQLYFDEEWNGVIAFIWDIIKDKVANRLFDEFDMLYRSLDSEEFACFIETGKQVVLDKLPSSIRQSIEDSKRYRVRYQAIVERASPLIVNSIFEESKSSDRDNDLENTQVSELPRHSSVTF